MSLLQRKGLLCSCLRCLRRAGITTAGDPDAHMNLRVVHWIDLMDPGDLTGCKHQLDSVPGAVTPFRELVTCGGCKRLMNLAPAKFLIYPRP